MDNWGFVVTGYAATAVALGGYVASLFARARRARRRSAAVAGKVRAGGSPHP
jgi:hypothetical protein